MRIVAAKILMPANVIKIKKRHRRQIFLEELLWIPRSPVGSLAIFAYITICIPTQEHGNEKTFKIL